MPVARKVHTQAATVQQLRQQLDNYRKNLPLVSQAEQIVNQVKIERIQQQLADLEMSPPPSPQPSSPKAAAILLAPSAFRVN